MMAYKNRVLVALHILVWSAYTSTIFAGGVEIITGTIVDKSGRPVSEYDVKVKNSKTGKASKLITDDSGVFELYHVKPGNYEVIINNQVGMKNKPVVVKSNTKSFGQFQIDQKIKIKVNKKAAKTIRKSVRDVINPEAAHTINAKAARQISPEAAKAINAQAAQTISPEAAKVINPGAARAINPEAAKNITPEAAKVINPDAARAINPEAAKTITPEAARVISPEVARILHPERAKKLNAAEAKKLTVDEASTPPKK